MSSTRTQVRQELLVRIPELGYAATADAAGIGTTYIADLSEFAHTTLGTDELRDRYFYRYLLTGNDRVKQTTTLNTTTGVISGTPTTAGNYTFTISMEDGH